MVSSRKTPKNYRAKRLRLLLEKPKDGKSPKIAVVHTTLLPRGMWSASRLKKLYIAKVKKMYGWGVVRILRLQHAETL